MADDADWVDDVRRWYLTGQTHANSAATCDAADSTAETEALGYEAADPCLQSRHWPDVPSRDATPALAAAR